MYETHFGFSGSPFQLNPDPAFYFDSRGHKNALSYLKFGAHQGEGFIVVTGEIGAGKTTLVRTLLESLDPSAIAAAQVVSTQLESGDLLRAILTAFGVPATGSSKAQLIASLEAFLTALAVKQRRALLIVDEAQNLDRVAVEELRMLSNFQLGTHGLLQSFLVGQPELRAILQSKSMEQLRQRVIASCHLGPLDEAETRAYVEHRLHRVGWAERPRFDADAFAQIFGWTGGVPRRINRLCNRVLLAACLAETDHITSDLVLQTAQELHAELGDSEAAKEVTPARSAPPAAPVAASVAPETTPATVAPVRPLLQAAQVIRRVQGPVEAPVLCLVDSPGEYLAAASLIGAMSHRSSVAQTMIVIRGAPEVLQFHPDFRRLLPQPAVDVYLHADAGSDARAAGDTVARFDALLAEYAPQAVLCFGRSDEIVACGLRAHRRGVPVAAVRMGKRRPWADRLEELNVELMERFACVLYTDSVRDLYTLQRVGIAPEKMHAIGDIVAAAGEAAAASISATDAIARLGLGVAPGSPYAVATLGPSMLQSASADLAGLVTLLEKGLRQTPLVWFSNAATIVELKARGLYGRLSAARIHVLAGVPYTDRLAALRTASCAIADSKAELVDEALAGGVPCVVVSDHGIFRLESEAVQDFDPTPEACPLDEVIATTLGLRHDVRTVAAPAKALAAAAALAEHLAGWLPSGVGPRSPSVTLIDSARRTRAKGRAS